MLAAALLWLLAAALAVPAVAGVMTREALARRFPSPLIVGEKDAALRIWPLLRQNATANARRYAWFRQALRAVCRWPAHQARITAPALSRRLPQEPDLRPIPDQG